MTIRELIEKLDEGVWESKYGYGAPIVIRTQPGGVLYYPDEAKINADGEFIIGE